MMKFKFFKMKKMRAKKNNYIMFSVCNILFANIWNGQGIHKMNSKQMKGVMSKTITKNVKI